MTFKKGDWVIYLGADVYHKRCGSLCLRRGGHYQATVSYRGEVISNPSGGSPEFWIYYLIDEMGNDCGYELNNDEIMPLDHYRGLQLALLNI